MRIADMRFHDGGEEQGLRAGRAARGHVHARHDRPAYSARRDRPGAGDPDVDIGLAIITEATPFFLGVGLPPTRPSPGALISIGNGYLFSGDRWIVAFAGLTLAVFVLAVNRLGDRLRDALNPRLR